MRKYVVEILAEMAYRKLINKSTMSFCGTFSELIWFHASSPPIIIEGDEVCNGTVLESKIK